MNALWISTKVKHRTTKGKYLKGKCGAVKRRASASTSKGCASSIEISAISRVAGLSSDFQCSTAELRKTLPLSSTMDYPQSSTPRLLKRHTMRTTRRQTDGVQPVGEEKNSTGNSYAFRRKVHMKPYIKHKSNLSAVGCLPTKLRTNRRKRVAKQSMNSSEQTAHDFRDDGVKMPFSNSTNSNTIQLDSMDLTLYTNKDEDENPKVKQVKRENSSKECSSKLFSSETFLVDSCRPPCEGKEASPARSKQTIQNDRSSLIVPVISVASMNPSRRLSVSKYSYRRMLGCDKEKSCSMTYVTRLNISDWPTLAVF